MNTNIIGLIRVKLSQLSRRKIAKGKNCQVSKIWAYVRKGSFWLWRNLGFTLGRSVNILEIIVLFFKGYVLQNLASIPFFYINFIFSKSLSAIFIRDFSECKHYEVKRRHLMTFKFPIWWSIDWIQTIVTRFSNFQFSTLNTLLNACIGKSWYF